MSSFFARRWFWYAVIALVFAGGTWYFFRTKPEGRRSSWGGRDAPVPVRAVPAERRDLPVYLKAIGTVVPFNTVVVRSRVEGQLLRIAFEEGQRVESGDLLAEIDPVPYRIRLAQAEAQQRQNAAQLENARADLERFRQLHAQTMVTQQQLEQQQALVADREAAAAADQAAVDQARLQLAYTRIEAPIAGRLGLRKVDVGNLVRGNDAEGLVVIMQTRPISVMFTVPEVDLAQVIDPLRAGEPLVVEALDRNEENRLATGKLTTVDNQIDLATGTLRLKAEFANEDERLFPNQFVNMRLRVRTLRDAIVIPNPAIQFGSRGTYVYTVNGQSQATVRDVVIGPSDGTWQAIAQGLSPGEPVVLEGLDRLREGRIVVMVEDAPAGDAGKAAPPTPAASGRKTSGGKGK
ncbi:MAG: MdtA/MuxA family multidrug efflux RND transporter periplasmic adaptor subunit [Opitutus sp.]